MFMPDNDNNKINHSTDWFFSCSFLALTHRYGRDGRDSKKFEDKSLLFDFNFLQAIVNQQFVNDYMTALNSFVLLLNENTKPGE